MQDVTTRLWTKGQLIIPRDVREGLGWRPGTELVVESDGKRLVLRQRERTERPLDAVAETP